MARTWKKLVGAVALSAALCVSGCSMLPDGLGGPGDDDGGQVDGDGIDVDEALEDGGAADPGTGSADAEPASGNPEPLQIDAQQVGATVHVAAMEYTVTAMDVVDLDAEAGREVRLEGARLVFSGSVTNPASDSQVASTQVVLQWEDPASGHSFESSGMVNSDAVPGGASGPLEFDLNLNVDHLETFDASTAVLLLGRHGTTRAQIPLGEGDLITRIPVPQSDLIGKSFDMDGRAAVTIEEADLRWDIDGGTEEGTGVLEIVVRLDNNSGSQTCWARGTGSNFSLIKADGTGTSDLSMSDRGCTASGDQTVSLTGIPVHTDYAGEYELTHTHDFGSDQAEDTITFTMVDEPGVLLSER